LCQEVELDSRSLHHLLPKEDTANEKQLVSALRSILEKLQNTQFPLYSKKYGQLPKCVAGGPCALRKGARIGKLCDCPRTTSCHSFLHVCL
ncbi:hypothetical protein JZ751_012397, partial [Albula glossodonta]